MKILHVHCVDMYGPAPQATADLDVISYNKGAKIAPGSINPPHKDYDLIVFIGGHGDFRQKKPILFNGLDDTNAKSLISQLHAKGVNAPKIVCDPCFSAAYIPQIRTLLTQTFQPAAIFCYLGSSPGYTHNGTKIHAPINPADDIHPAAIQGKLGQALEQWIISTDKNFQEFMHPSYRPYALYVQGRNGTDPRLAYIETNHSQQASNTYCSILGGGNEWSDVVDLKAYLTTQHITLRPDPAKAADPSKPPSTPADHWALEVAEFTLSVRNALSFGI